METDNKNIFSRLMNEVSVKMETDNKNIFS